MRRSTALLVVASCFWLSSAVEARALSLADLAAAGASFTSSEGQLTFSNFDLSDLVASGFDPEFIDVVPIDFGFRLENAEDGLGVYDGRTEDPLFHFDVQSSRSITGIQLGIESPFNEPIAQGAGSLVRVEVSSGDLLTSLLLAELDEGQGGSATDSEGLSPAMALFSLWTRLNLISGDGDSRAFFPQIEYHFETVVPEPGTASLLILGLAGAGWLRRRS